MAPISGRGPISTFSIIILSMSSIIGDLWSAECSLANLPAFAFQPLSCLFPPAISIPHHSFLFTYSCRHFVHLGVNVCVMACAAIFIASFYFALFMCLCLSF